MNRALSTLTALIFFFAAVIGIGLLPLFGQTPTATTTPTASPAPTYTVASPTVSPTPSPDQPITSIQWSGYKWRVTDYREGVFTSKNVWVDQDGKLHMKLIYDNGTWHGFNLILDDYVGYGTFKWRIDSDVKYIQDTQDGGNPYFWFSPFLYDNNLPNNGYGEVDVEYCKWSRSGDQTNCDWTTYNGGKHVEKKAIVGAYNDETITWTPDYVKFEAEGPEQPYMEYTNYSASPRATGTMQFIIMIGQWRKGAPPGGMDRYEAEVVLSYFDYTPYSNTPQNTHTPTPRPTISPTMSPSQSIKYIRWSNATWEVTDYNGGVFTSKNVWVDQDGKLHMKLIYDNGTWHGFNLILDDYVGYGTFKWRTDSDIGEIQDVKDGGNPYFTFSQLLYDNSIPEYGYGEIDVEHSKEGDANSKTNLDWVIWPDNHSIESRHITGPDNEFTLKWTKDQIRFEVQGPEQPHMEYTFDDASKIPPSTGQMRFILWIGQRHNTPPPNGGNSYEAEVVLSDFQYVPA